MAVVRRREFLRTSAALSIGYFVAAGVEAQPPHSPNERIALAAIGVEGKGRSDTKDAAGAGDLVAICDVDAGTLGRVGEKLYPKAKRYADYRKMFEELGGGIDAVTVSTPDHVHAPAALMAMRMGKHCFCQKPLSRTLYEARLMGRVAREKKLATQMGNQGTASDALRRGAAMLRAGVLGDVTEIHVWTNRPIWPQGLARPSPGKCPKTLDWNLWLGPAPERPFAEGYHPFKWRGWWDFGAGALGDMGCHEINMAFMGLDLRNPASVQAVTSGHNGDSFPKWSIVTYQFAALPTRPAVKLVWYDGGKTPPAELLEGRKLARGGDMLTVGTKGKLLGMRAFIGVEGKDVKFPKSPGHFAEWIRAIRGGPAPMSNFPDYAGPLTETVLLGNLAVWAAAKTSTGDKEPAAIGPTITWDSADLRASGAPGLEALVRPTYRAGYTLDG